MGILNFLLRLDADLYTQKMRNPLFQHAGQRRQARAGSCHGEGQAMAEVVGDLMGEVQQKVVALARIPVAHCIVWRQHLQIDSTQWRVALCQQPPHITQAAGLVEHVKHGLVAAKDLPVLRVNALGSE